MTRNFAVFVSNGFGRCDLLIFLLLGVTTVMVHGQEAPAYTIPTMGDTSGIPSVRTNFCNRRDLPRRDSLRGMQITVGIFDYQLTSEGGDHAVGGVIPPTEPDISLMMLDELATRAGFTWRDSYALINQPTENQTWTDILYWTTETYDLIGDWFAREVYRLANGIIYPEGWHDGSFILVSKINDSSNKNDEFIFDLWAFLKPFSTGVWLLILGTVVASALVFYGVMRLEQTGLNVGDSMFLSVFSFAGHYNYVPESVSSRIFSVSLCLVSLAIVSIYTANLASFLIVRNTNVVSISSIEEAISLGKRICTVRNSITSNFMELKYPTAKMVFTAWGEKNYFKDLSNGACDVALLALDQWLYEEGNIESNGDCDLEWVGRVVERREAGFAIMEDGEFCSSQLRDVLTFHMVEMKQDGTFDKIWDSYRRRERTVDCATLSNQNGDDGDSDGSGQQRLTVTSVGGIFICHAVVLVLTIGLAFYDYGQRSNKKTSQEHEIQDGMGKESNDEEEVVQLDPMQDMGKRSTSLDPPAQPMLCVGLQRHDRGDAVHGHGRDQEAFQMVAQQLQHVLDKVEQLSQDVASMKKSMVEDAAP